MTKEQISQIKTQLSELTPEFIDQQLATHFEESSLEVEKIGEYTVSEFAGLLKRALAQLEVELESERGPILPMQTGTPNVDYGTFSLHSEIQQILVPLRQMSAQPAPNQPKPTPNFGNLANHLKKLIFYQITFGFWDRTERPIADPDTTRLQAMEDRLNTLQASLDAQIQRNSELNESLAEEKQKLTNFQQQKEKQLAQITNNLQTANQEKDQISQLLNAATQTNTQLDGLKTAADKTAGQIDNLRTQQQKSKDQFEAKLKQEEARLKKEIEAILTPSQKEQASLTALRQEFDEYKTKFEEWNIKQRLAELEELIQTEAASQLFKTFDKRKRELGEPVKFWQNAVLWVAGGVILLGLVIFTNFFGLVEPAEGTEGWQALLISSLKMVPAIILLYFVIRQYAKERAFQEEYAFRSAVALTVKAYADLIAGTKGEEIKNQLIADAVKDVYRSPKPMSWEGGTLFAFRTRDLTESVKSLTEMVKELKIP